MELVIAAQEIATSQAAWAILFIVFSAFVFIEMRNDNRRSREAAETREEKLMEHLSRSNDSQEKTANALESINRTLNTLEGRVHRIEKITYKERN